MNEPPTGPVPGSWADKPVARSPAAAAKGPAHSEALLHATLAAVDDAVLVVSATGHISHYNSRFLEIWSIPPALAASANDNTLISIAAPQLESPDEFGASTAAIYQSDARTHDILRFKDGRIVERFSAPVAGPGSDPERVWVFRDITSRVSIEESLRSAKARLESIFRASPAGIGLISGRVLREVNDASCRLTGFSREELIGAGTRQIYPSAEDFAAAASLYDRLDEDPPPMVETRWQHKDGRILNILMCAAPLNRADPGQGAMALAIDITKHKQAEQQYQAIIQTAIDGFWRIDPMGRITEVNDAICTLLGFTREELLLRNVAELEPNEAPAEVAAHFSRIATGRDRFETRLLRKHGPSVDVDISVNRIPAPAEGFFVFIRDITERRHKEAELRRNEERFRLVAERTGHLICDYDLATQRSQWFGDSVAMLGYSAGFLNNANPIWWTDQIHPDDRDRAVAGWRSATREGVPDRTLYRFRRTDGHWVHLMASVVRIANADGTNGRVLSAIADITPQQEAAEKVRQLNAELEQRVRERTAELDHRVTDVERLNTELRASQLLTAQATIRLQETNANLVAANQELESFSYSISHDLRAPLRNIAGFVELLRKRTAHQLEPEADRYFGIVGSEAVRMATLIDDLLAFSRIGRAELHLGPVQISALLDEVQSELSADLAGREIEWRIHTMPAVLGDRTLLRQVIANLVGNAVKFTRRQPRAIIEIGARSDEPEPGFIAFFVRDNGAGFDPKYADKLFGVFQRLHNPREFEGTGIGLANVKRIIDRHGGKVWAESNRDHGATFYFSLRPAGPEPSHPLPRPPLLPS